jgi:hypothetical protein
MADETTKANAVALVAMHSPTNFFNNVFDPEKDFPAVTPGRVDALRGCLEMARRLG